MKISRKTIGVWILIILCASPISFLIVRNLRLSYQRGKQTRNMVDLRAISTATEAYDMDFGKYPKVKSIYELKKYLQPKYIKTFPITDAWGNDFIYQSNGDSYTVISLGKDHRPDLKPYVNGPISHFTDDIVFSNGSFVRFPEGT